MLGRVNTMGKASMIGVIIMSMKVKSTVIVSTIDSA
jgi:hypothetical protein